MLLRAVLRSLSVFLLHLGDKASRMNGVLVAVAALHLGVASIGLTSYELGRHLWLDG